MWDGATGRVVVGVDLSLEGLRALRAAVEQARWRGMELRAVRAFEPPQDDIWYDRWPNGELHPAAGSPQRSRPEFRDRWVTRERETQQLVARAFEEAMGRVPPDLRVTFVTNAGPPRRVLLDAASREEDLLVVGTSHRRQWWPFRRSICRYCLARARCAVLVVPPQEAGRELARWRLLQRRRELSSLLADAAPRSGSG